MRIYDVLVQTLRNPAGQNAGPVMPLSDLIAALGPRSFGVMLVLFGLPNLLPVPGLPMVCGVIIGVVAYQMLTGKESLILPGWLGNRGLKRDDLVRVVSRAEPSLRMMERVMRPRLLALTDAKAQRLIGGILLVLAIALLAPIPFFGGIPPGIAVILLGLALTERDGLFVIFGACATVIALAITIGLTYAILRSVIFFFG